MTTHDETHRRAVVLDTSAADGDPSPVARLLIDRGYQVAPADTLDETIELLTDAGAELLVVETDAAQRRQTLSRLSSLPADHRPRHIAIFAEGSDDQLNALRRTVAPSHVSVLLRPLHLHRLLTVLRRIEGDAPQLARV
jgi:hypothetical protein